MLAPVYSAASFATSSPTIAASALKVGAVLYEVTVSRMGPYSRPSASAMGPWVSTYARTARSAASIAERIAGMRAASADAEEASRTRVSAGGRA